MIDALILLAKGLPVIAILWYEVKYFKNKEKAYIATIDNLHAELRAVEKETLTIMSKLTHTIDRIYEDNKDDRAEVLAELQSIKTLIAGKL